MTVPAGGQAHDGLAQAVGYADGVLDAVTPHLLSQPTPCRAWNLRMLLEHVGESITALHEGVSACRVSVSPTPALTLADGAGSAALLVSVCRQRAAALLRASAQADGTAPVTIDGYPMPLDCLRTAGALEIAVHAWDISQACGQHRPIPDRSATELLAQALVLVPPLGRYPLFGHPVPVAPGATPSDRLTAYLGRPAR